MLPSRPPVTTAVTLIAHNAEQREQSFLIKNKTNTESVYLGGEAVTTATGLEWATTDGSLSVDLKFREKLYGIVATNTQTLHVLENGVA